MKESLGIYISNSNFCFSIKKLITFNNYIVLITIKNEIIVYKNENNKFNKKYILLSKIQDRKNIFDIVLVKGQENILVIIFIIFLHLLTF